jgi:hypothetical protein
MGIDPGGLKFGRKITKRTYIELIIFILLLTIICPVPGNHIRLLEEL